jgi:hypothetical protein
LAQFAAGELPQDASKVKKSPAPSLKPKAFIAQLFLIMTFNMSPVFRAEHGFFLQIKIGLVHGHI